MQFPTNAALDAALAPGGVRAMTVLCQFDWTRDGTFSSVYSDLSDLVTDWVLDKQATGSYPSDLEIVEGYAGAVLTLTLAGNANDAKRTAVWRLFSPYAGFLLGSAGYVGAAVQLSMVVATGGGPVTIRQFTGVVQSALPSRGNSNVVITCLDGAGICQKPITLPPWASSATIQNLLGGTNPLAPDVFDSCQIQANWLIEHCLREAGAYAGPKWPANTMLAWTLTGSGLPSVGNIGTEDNLINGTFQFGYGEFLIPSKVPGSPDPPGSGKSGGFGVWVQPSGFTTKTGGNIPYLYGTAFIGTANLDPWAAGPAYVTNVTGNAHAASNFPTSTYPNGPFPTEPPNVYAGNNSNLIVMGAWVFRDSSQSNSALSTIQMHLEEARYDYHYQSGAQYPAQAWVNLNHNTGIIDAHVKNNGWGTTWNWTTTTAIPLNTWTYVCFVFQFTSTGIFGYCQTAAGTALMTGGTNGGTASPIGATPYAFPVFGTPLGQVIASGPMTYVSISYQYDTLWANFVTPPSVPVNTVFGQPQIDISATRLNWLPDTVNQPIWDVLKAVVEAEFGIIYFDEFDSPIFIDHYSIQSLKASNPIYTITLDQLQDLTPQTMLDSVINSLSMAWTKKQAVEYSVAYSESGATDLQVAANATRDVNVTTKDVQSFRTEFMSYRPQSQGWGFPAGTKENSYDFGGAGPGVGFTYKDWMSFYGPSFWTDGFAGHIPSGNLQGAQPARDAGMNCEVLLGWSGTAGYSGPGVDYDPRHMHLFMSNQLGSTAYFSVDDTTPFFHVQGTVIQQANTGVLTTSNTTSQSTYGSRALELPTSDWNQDPASLQVVLNGIQADLQSPTPYMSSIPVLGDPRRQLLDTCRVTDPQGMGSMNGVLIGVHREYSNSSGLTDSLTVRLLSTGYAWVLDDPDLSILDSTTWLA